MVLTTIKWSQSYAGEINNYVNRIFNYPVINIFANAKAGNCY